MSDQRRTLLKKADIILIFVLLILCAFLFVQKGVKKDGTYAVIYHNGTVIQTIDLTKVSTPYQFTVGDSIKGTIRVEKGRIRYLDSQCHDQLCVKCGWLDQSEETAVCLPAKTMIVIRHSAKDHQAPDVIAY